MSEVRHRYGEFVWRELLTPDPGRSVAFYTAVVGWQTELFPMPTPGSQYILLKAGDRTVGGLMASPAPGVTVHWSLHISVEDVDATSARATEAGGRVLTGPLDGGGMGRFATLQDPSGGVINAWKGMSGDGQRNPRPGVGEFCWEQLNSSDLGRVQTFYQRVFGWTEQPFPCGGPGKVFAAGSTPVGSTMQTPPGIPSHWMTYVRVDSLVAVNGRARQHGGKVLMPRVDLPAVGSIVEGEAFPPPLGQQSCPSLPTATAGSISVIQDPLGAVLGFFEAPGH